MLTTFWPITLYWIKQPACRHKTNTRDIMRSYSYIFIVTIFLSNFCITTPVKAQKSRSLGLQLNTTGIFTGQVFRLGLTPMAIRQTHSHTIGIGPLAIIASDMAASNEGYPRLTGLRAAYRFYPSGYGKPFNFFISANVNALRMREKWASISWDIPRNQYINFNYESTELLVQPTLGYGIEGNITRQLTISQSIGVGAYYSTISHEAKTPDAPEPTHTHINGYDAFGFSYVLNLSLRYAFEFKKGKKGRHSDGVPDSRPKK